MLFNLLIINCIIYFHKRICFIITVAKATAIVGLFMPTVNCLLKNMFLKTCSLEFHSQIVVNFFATTHANFGINRRV